jgi:hypothetical protein
VKEWKGYPSNSLTSATTPGFSHFLALSNPYQWICFCCSYFLCLICLHRTQTYFFDFFSHTRLSVLHSIPFAFFLNQLSFRDQTLTPSPVESSPQFTLWFTSLHSMRLRLSLWVFSFRSVQSNHGPHVLHKIIITFFSTWHITLNTIMAVFHSLSMRLWLSPFGLSPVCSLQPKPWMSCLKGHASPTHHYNRLVVLGIDQNWVGIIQSHASGSVVWYVTC